MSVYHPGDLAILVWITTDGQTHAQIMNLDNALKELADLRSNQLAAWLDPV